VSEKHKIRFLIQRQSFVYALDGTLLEDEETMVGGGRICGSSAHLSQTRTGLSESTHGTIRRVFEQLSQKTLPQAKELNREDVRFEILRLTTAMMFGEI